MCAFATKPIDDAWSTIVQLRHTNIHTPHTHTHTQHKHRLPSRLPGWLGRRAAVQQVCLLMFLLHACDCCLMFGSSCSRPCSINIPCFQPTHTGINTKSSPGSQQPVPGGLHSRDKMLREVKAFSKLKPSDAKYVWLCVWV